MTGTIKWGLRPCSIKRSRMASYRRFRATDLFDLNYMYAAMRPCRQN